MATCVGLAMLTFLSCMVNARTSSFIGRTLAGNRIGLTLRSVGSNSVFPLVHCSRQEWHAVCQRVRKVHQFPVNGVFFCAFWCLLDVLCTWGVLALLSSLSCTRLGLLWCASSWTRPLGGGRLGHYLCNLWEDHLKVHKNCLRVSWDLRGFLDVGAKNASPQRDSPDSMVMMHVWFIGQRRHLGEIAGKYKVRPLFLLSVFFLLSRNSLVRFWSVVFGLGGQDTLGHPLLISFLVLKFSMLEAG